jgi:hypothetical protein
MPKEKKRSGNTRFVKTRGEVAQALDVSLQSIATYVAEGAPKKGPKGYDVDAFIRWRAENKAPLRGPEDGQEKTGDLARLLKAQADEREIKASHADLRLSIDRGEYLPIAEVKERDIARITMVKRGLLAFERSLSPRLVGLGQLQISVIIRKAVRDLLEKFSKM